MITINLLPWREKARKAKKIRAILIAVGFILLALFIIFSLHVYLTILINHQQKRNDYLQSVITNETQQIATLEIKKKSVMAVESDIDFIVSLRRTSYQAIKLLDVLPRILPDSVTLTKLTKEGHDITLFGKSKSNIQITYLMEHIAKIPFFKQQTLIEISDSKHTGAEGRYFQLKIQKQE